MPVADTLVVDTPVVVATPVATVLELPGDTTAGTTTADTMVGVTDIMAAITMGHTSILGSASVIHTTVTAPTIMDTRITSDSRIHTTAITPTIMDTRIITATTPTLTAVTPPTPHHP